MTFQLGVRHNEGNENRNLVRIDLLDAIAARPRGWSCELCLAPGALGDSVCREDNIPDGGGIHDNGFSDVHLVASAHRRCAMKWLLSTFLFLSVVTEIEAASFTNSTYVICEGDSLTECNGAVPRNESNWVAQSFNVLNPTYGTWLTNMGHSGDKLELLSDYANLGGENTNMLQVLSFLTNLTTYTNVTLLFQGGGNDFYNPSTVTQVTNYMHACLTNVKARFPNVRIGLATILLGSGETDPAMIAKFVAYNGLIRSNHFGVSFVNDWYGDPRLTNTLDLGYFDPDQVHPNNAGCSVQAGICMSNLISNRRVQDAFFVRKDGSDSNTGTTNNSTGAFLTIGKAATVVTLGDWVVINDGYYAEDVALTADGISTDPILFYGASTAVSNGGWNLTGARYNFIHTISATGTNAAVNDGAINLDASSHWNTFSNVAVNGFGTTSTGKDFWKGISGGMLVSGKSNLFDNIRVTNSNYHYFVIGGDWNRLTNCVATGRTGWDVVRVVNSSVTISALLITNLANTPFTGGALLSGTTYGYVTATNGDFSNVGGGVPGTYNVGDSFTASSSGTPTSYGSTLLDNANHSDCFQTFGDDPATISTNVVIELSRVYNASGYQFGNITDDQEDGRVGAWTFRNDLFADIDSTMNLYAPKFRFLHCAFVRVGRLSSWAIIFGSSPAGHADELWVVNCIFDMCGVTNNANNGWYSGDVITGSRFSHNSVRGSVNKTGYTPETGSIKDQNPLLNSLYQPTNGSPVISVGTNLLAYFTTDILGNARSSTPNMGPFEGTYQPDGSGGGGVVASFQGPPLKFLRLKRP